MEEYRDDIKSKLHYMDEILHKISFMSQAENEKRWKIYSSRQSVYF